MDPNSGKMYYNPTDETIKRNGLVEVSERVANFMEAGRRANVQQRWDQRKSVKRKKRAMAKASRRANR